MSLKFNIRHLEQHNLSLQGELSPAELEIESLDELIHFQEPLLYDLELQKMENAVLAQGSLRVVLHCECARCLKAFDRPLSLEEWACHLPLKGEEKVEIVNDVVDLTPFVREDILLSLPQQPLCEPECKGLRSPGKNLASGGLEKKDLTTPAWAELNKLNL